MTPTEIRQAEARKKHRLPPLDSAAMKRMESRFRQGLPLKQIAAMFKVGTKQVSHMMRGVKWGCERD